MKGTIFQSPLEYQLNVNGEQWSQGDKVSGTLKIINHGNEKLSLKTKGVSLAYGNNKKIKKNDIDAFTINSSHFLDELNLAPNQSEQVEWSFNLSSDCEITDKLGSFYLVYGSFEIESNGKLQLTILPKKSICDFLEIFENFFRFKVKDKKSKKGWIETKLIPPSSKEFATLDSLILSMRHKDDGLELNYKFKVKKLNYSAANLDSVKAEKKEIKFSQTLDKKDYQSFEGAPNQAVILKSLEDALELVKNNNIY